MRGGDKKSQNIFDSSSTRESKPCRFSFPRLRPGDTSFGNHGCAVEMSLNSVQKRVPVHGVDESVEPGCELDLVAARLNFKIRRFRRAGNVDVLEHPIEVSRGGEQPCNAAICTEISVLQRVLSGKRRVLGMSISPYSKLAAYRKFARRIGIVKF